MKVLLSIGCELILLPDDAGLVTIMKQLSRGIAVRDLRYSSNPHLVVDRDVDLKMEYVKNGTPLVSKKQPRDDTNPSADCIEIGDGHGRLKLSAGG